jgi:hypothetical protein
VPSRGSPMPRLRPAGIAAALIAGVATVTAVALADTTRITDGTKTRGPLDITSASAGHASSSKLLHTIVTDGRIPRTRKASFCLRMYFDRPSTRSSRFAPIDRMICANPRQTHVDVVKPRAGGPDPTFGTAAVIVRDQSLSFRFRHASIKNARDYFWAVDSLYHPSRGVCSGRGGCFDSAPNGRKTVRHHIPSLSRGR